MCELCRWRCWSFSSNKCRPAFQPCRAVTCDLALSCRHSRRASSSRSKPSPIKPRVRVSAMRNQTVASGGVWLTSPARRPWMMILLQRFTTKMSSMAPPWLIRVHINYRSPWLSCKKYTGQFVGWLRVTGCNCQPHTCHCSVWLGSSAARNAGS